MLTIGGGEMFVIILLGLVLFGPKKLPELFRTVSKYYGEFRRASNDLKATFEKELHSLELDTRDIKASLERELLSLHEETKDLHLMAQQTAQELSDHASYNYGLGDDHGNHDHEQNPYLIADAHENAHESGGASSAEHSDHVAIGVSNVAHVESSAISHSDAALAVENELQMVNLPAFVPATEGTVARGEAIAHQIPLTLADEAAQAAHDAEQAAEEAEQAIHNDTVHHG